MFELLLVGALVALLGAAGLLAMLPWDQLVGAGMWIATAGLVVGVPAGALYHLQLYRRLGPRGALAPRWWLRPHAFHGALAGEERPGVMGWFWIGAVGFMVTIGGIALTVAG